MASLCQVNPPRQLRTRLGVKRIAATVTGSVAIALSLFTAPAFAGDPFRGTNAPHAIGDRTEAAFKAIFEQGNYVAAADLLKNAESNEPLAYAMKASLANLNEDWEGLGRNATLTRETAERLVATDPLRGHLYTAVGYFLEGAYALRTQGTVAATPTVLGKLQQVFDALDKAEAISPNDPELNLLKGYMDLMLAVNLPFSNPGDAIQRLESHAAPRYLALRGMAIGYRDLRQLDQAKKAVDDALALTPNNPDLLYLKAQILRLQNKNQESIDFFGRALQSRAQLPQIIVGQIVYEQCRTRGLSSGECSNLRRSQRQQG